LKPRTPFLHPETVKGHLDKLDTGLAVVEKDLKTAYDEIFKRNTTNDIIEHCHARKIYKILLCCKVPLLMAAVMVAVAFDEDNGSRDESIDHAYIRQLT
jgi:hypothetical protein